MAPIAAQQAVEEYHREMAAMPGMGMNMFEFHTQWHIDNRDPTPPDQIDPNWATGIDFGTRFLQMHHEMVRAADDEPKQFMMHQSLVGWYQGKGYDLPPEWDPATTIPPLLAYAPDLTVYPQRIQELVEQWAQQ
jgi:hypothetical protein